MNAVMYVVRKELRKVFDSMQSMLWRRILWIQYAIHVLEDVVRDIFVFTWFALVIASSYAGKLCSAFSLIVRDLACRAIACYQLRCSRPSSASGLDVVRNVETPPRTTRQAELRTADLPSFATTSTPTRRRLQF